MHQPQEPSDGECHWPVMLAEQPERDATAGVRNVAVACLRAGPVPIRQHLRREVFKADT